MFTWSRNKGYECSTKGDPRFSAFNAIMPDGRSIESWYQVSIKGYGPPGGTNWRLGKGKPPLNPNTDLWAAYLELWREWARNHEELILELYFAAIDHNYTLRDRFASSPVNQARALAQILNEKFTGEEEHKWLAWDKLL